MLRAVLLCFCKGMLKAGSAEAGAAGPTQLIPAPRASSGTKAALTRSYLEKVEFDLLLRDYEENVKEFLLCVCAFCLLFLSDLHTC